MAERPDELSELADQVERGNLFVHATFSEQATRVNEAEALAFGLAELLIRGGVISPEALQAAMAQARDGIAGAGKEAKLDVAIRTDGPEPTVSAEAIDCEARIPHCHAVCCKLRFPLTIEEIEHGPVKWDLGRPYFNRHGPHGYCHQMDTETLGCQVYEERPMPCRQYSCAGDDRIWKDFDAMVINQEWIDEHVNNERSPVEIFMAAHEG